MKLDEKLQGRCTKTRLIVRILCKSVVASAFTEGRGQSDRGHQRGHDILDFVTVLLLIIHTSEC